MSLPLFPPTHNFRGRPTQDADALRSENAGSMGQRPEAGSSGYKERKNHKYFGCFLRERL